jgi:hypothetical protein
MATLTWILKGLVCNYQVWGVRVTHANFRSVIKTGSVTPSPALPRGNSPLMECMNGRCINSTVGLWSETCGSSTGVKCARQDPISKFQLRRVQNRCTYVNGFLDHPRTFGGALASRDYGCVAQTLTSRLRRPIYLALPPIPTSTNVCGESWEGERCDCDNQVVYRNRESSGIHRARPSS